MPITARIAIWVMRAAALIVTVFSASALWNVMLWLPWQVDCVAAGAAAFAFAYAFERGEAGS